jgi:hypothetical protein
MKISKQLAKEIAAKLTVKARNVAEEAFKKRSDYVHGVCLKKTPRAIINAFKNHREYFGTCTSVLVEGNGFKWQYVQLVKPAFLISPSSDTLRLDLSGKKVCEEFTALHRAWVKADEEYKKLFSEVETALLGLKTHSAIEKHFPEAKPYLPKQQCMALQINLEPLRAKLK